MGSKIKFKLNRRTCSYVCVVVGFCQLPIQRWVLSSLPCLSVGISLSCNAETTQVYINSFISFISFIILSIVFRLFFFRRF